MKNESLNKSHTQTEVAPKLVCYENGVYQGYFHNNYRDGLGIYIWNTGEFYFGSLFHD